MTGIASTCFYLAPALDGAARIVNGCRVAARILYRDRRRGDWKKPQQEAGSPEWYIFKQARRHFFTQRRAPFSLYSSAALRRPAFIRNAGRAASTDTPAFHTLWRLDKSGTKDLRQIVAMQLRRLSEKRFHVQIET